jgi:osmotically-inducible protein OsmY
MSSIDNVDDGIESKVQDALANSPLLALRRLVVECDEQSLVISGRVATFYQKQQAQEVVRNLADGLHVVNQVEVT